MPIEVRLDRDQSGRLETFWYVLYLTLEEVGGQV